MEVLLHPSRAMLLAKFPSTGLELDSHSIRTAIESQLEVRNAPVTDTQRPSRPDERPIRGLSRLFRAASSPYLFVTSYEPQGSAPIPDREVYRAMSFPPETMGTTPKPSADKADGLLVFGTHPRYTVFVQAEDPFKQHHIRGLRDYRDNVMPPTEHDNFKVAAIRALTRLGLM